MIPRFSSARVVTTGEVLDRADFEGDRAADDRDRAALLEDVDAEAREAGDRVGEVGLAGLLELGQRAHLGHVVEGLLGVVGPQRLVTLELDELAVLADRRFLVDLDVEVGTLPLDQLPERFVDLEHPDLYRPGCPRL